MKTHQKLKLQGATLDKKLKRGGPVKEIVLKFCFLDVLTMKSNIMGNKCFNLFDECKARCVHFTVPSGKIDPSQRKSTEIKKTEAIVNVRVLLKQAIRYLNTFRITSNEIPASLLTIC